MATFRCEHSLSKEGSRAVPGMPIVGAKWRWCPFWGNKGSRPMSSTFGDTGSQQEELMTYGDILTLFLHVKGEERRGK